MDGHDAADSTSARPSTATEHTRKPHARVRLQYILEHHDTSNATEHADDAAMAAQPPTEHGSGAPIVGLDVANSTTARPSTATERTGKPQLAGYVCTHDASNATEHADDTAMATQPPTANRQDTNATDTNATMQNPQNG